MLYDTHAHLNDPRFEHDLGRVLERAREARVALINVVGWDIPSSRKAVQLAEAHPDTLRAVVGVHPVSAAEFDNHSLQELRRMTEHPLVVAVGEIGMDFHWDTTTPQQQEKAFRAQMELAKQAGLPVVLHIRKAWPRVWELLSAHGFPRGVMHSFSGNQANAKDAVEQGYLLSVPPVILRGSKKLKKAARAVGPEHLLIETDCPYMSPVKGQRNEPANLRAVLEKLAEILDMDRAELEEILWQNSKKAFEGP